MGLSDVDGVVIRRASGVSNKEERPRKFVAALNLVMIALSTIPRGGRLTVTLAGESTAPLVTLRTQGLNARIPTAVTDLLAGRLHEGPIDPHSIQPYYAGLIARAAGMAVTLRMDGDDVLIEAVPAA